uniref:Uncharacterized protein n=1 Tax=Glossina austeni TaxID=7395 RepID=A0A1A9V007_GLOAU
MDVTNTSKALRKQKNAPDNNEMFLFKRNEVFQLIYLLEELLARDSSRLGKGFLYPVPCYPVILYLYVPAFLISVFVNCIPQQYLRLFIRHHLSPINCCDKPILTQN